MDLLDKKSTKELTACLLAEIAKSSNELTHAENDLNKARSRLHFAIVLANKLINRSKDNAVERTGNETKIN